MGCRRAWNDEFLDMNFTKAFRTGAYKKHREDILLEREIAILPTRQPRVEATLKTREILEKMKKVNEELYEWEKKRQEILKVSSNLSRGLTRYTAESEGRAPPAWTLTEGEAKSSERAKFVMKCPFEDCRGFLSTAYKCGTCQQWACPDCLVIKGKDKDVEHTCDPGVKETVALIIKESKPCPKCGERISKIDGCFAENTPILLWDSTLKMSQDICVGDELVGDNGEKRIVQEICSGEDELFEVTQTRGVSYTVNSKHTLVLKDISGISVEILVDDYMQLPKYLKDNLYGYKSNYSNPNKDWMKTSIHVKGVGRGIYYGWNVGDNHRFVLSDMTVTKNCDQMWCIDCHTAFSWATGQLVNGVVHNPHYYEFLRQQGNGVAPRNAGDVPCGGVPYYHHLQTNITQLDRTTQNTIMAIHRMTAEITDFRLAVYQGQFNVNDNGDLGVAYLMKEMTKDQIKVELAKRELKRNKHLAIRAILEMFVNTSTMMLNNIVSQPPGDTKKQKISGMKSTLKKIQQESLDSIKFLTMLKEESPSVNPDTVPELITLESMKIVRLEKQCKDLKAEILELEKNLMAEVKTEFEPTLAAFANLRIYVNDSLMGVSRMKNCSVPQINATWQWVPFNKTAVKAKVKKETEAPVVP